MELIKTQKNQRIINVDDNEEEDQQKTNEKIIYTYTNMEYGNKKSRSDVSCHRNRIKFQICCIYVTNNLIYTSLKRDIDSFFLSGTINEGVNI